MKKVKSLPRHRLPKELEHGVKSLLAGIISGQVTSVAYVAMVRGGAIATNFAAMPGQEVALIGGMEYCKHRLETVLDNWGEVPQE